MANIKAGIDSSGAKKGGKEVVSALDKIKDEAKVTAKGVAKSGDKMEKSFDDVKRKAKTSAKSISDSLKSMAGPLAAATAAFAAVSLAMVGTANAIDEVTKGASRLDLTTGAFQNLKLMSDITGTSFDNTKNSVKDLTLRMGQANDGNKTVLKTFKDLGVELKDVDGKARKVEDVWYDSIAALQNLESASERAAKGQVIMGESVTQIANITKLSNKELIEFKENTKGLISEEAQVAAANFNDALTLLTAQLSGRFFNAMAGVLEGVTKLLEGLTALSEHGMTPLIAKLLGLSDAQSTYSQSTKDAVDAAKNQKDAVVDEVAELAKLEDRLKRITAERERIAAFGVEASTVGLEKEITALKAQIATKQALIKEDAVVELSLNEQLEASKLLQIQALAEAVKLHDEMVRVEKIDADADAYKIGLAAYDKAEKEKTKIARKATTDRINLEVGAAKTIASSLTTVASVFKDQSTKAFKWYQAISATETSIATAQAVMTTFKTYGATPWGYAAAGAVGLAGAAKVHQILSMSPGSTAGGDTPAQPATAATGGVSPAQQITQLAPAQQPPAQINIYTTGVTDAETFERSMLPALKDYLTAGGVIFDEDANQTQIIKI